FDHFSVFMASTFMGLIALRLLGFTGESKGIYGLALAGALLVVFGATMVGTGLLGVAIERICLRPMRGVSGTAPMITTIGVAFVIINVVQLTWGPHSKPFPRIVPDRRWEIGLVESVLMQ